MTVFRVERKEPVVQLAGAKKRKTFFQSRPENGTWVYNLDGIARRPLPQQVRQAQQPVAARRRGGRLDQ